MTRSAEAVFHEALVWDQLFPVTETCGSFQSHCAMLQRMRAVGYNVVSISVAYDPDDTLTALHRISRWRQHVLGDPGLCLLDEVADLAGVQAAGQLAVGFHFQGTTPFGRDLSLVETFRRLGVHQALLAYNKRNHVADGCHEVTDSGLSGFGREMVAEMQRVGMLVDLSHTGNTGAEQAFAMAKAPMVYSHANAWSVYAHDRNIPDELAQACIGTGGMIGVNGVGMFLGTDRALPDALFAHLDHWVQLLGIDRVGIGLDAVTDVELCIANLAQMTSQWPADQGYQAGELHVCDPEDLLALTDRALRAGYSRADCAAFLGGNWASLFAKLAQRTPG